MDIDSRHRQNESMDKTTWIGLLVGFGAILLGNALEGGHIDSLLQFTAFLIVLGGTIGAVLVSNPTQDVKRGFGLLKNAFKEEDNDEVEKIIREIVDCARFSKKETLVQLEQRLPSLHSPFLRKTLRNVVDGVDGVQIRDIFETEISCKEDELHAAVKIWNDAGGFSPTIGIIGAVLGLIHVMGNLTDTSKLGAGIAVAFVATVYGVSFANLLFLPIANKLKKKVAHQIKIHQMVLEGTMMIQSEINPLVIDQKMRAFIYNDSHKSV